MKIHEFQAKQILQKYGVPVPRGKVAYSAKDIAKVTTELGMNKCVVKAQIHAGGRGKGGGVKVCVGNNEIVKNAESILGMNLVTNQTGPLGQKVKKLLIEESIDISKELYCSILVDRGKQCIVVLASTEGGMDIEDVAEKTPEKIFKIFVDPRFGLQPFQANELAFHLEINKINPKLIRPSAEIFLNLYRAFVREDCSLLEINPLILTNDGRVIALDAKLVFDDNAIFRHLDHLSLRDIDEEDQLELEASKSNLNYIKLEGNIGCMVNGAGLAMGTMDIIKSYGGNPANFLDVGGSANQETVEKAFQIISKDSNVKCILINIFGGIVQCDMVASGVIAAFKNVNLKIPVVVRLEGTNSEKANTIVKESGLGETLILANGIRDAAEKAVAITS